MELITKLIKLKSQLKIKNKSIALIIIGTICFILLIRFFIFDDGFQFQTHRQIKADAILPQVNNSPILSRTKLDIPQDPFIVGIQELKITEIVNQLKKSDEILKNKFNKNFNISLDKNIFKIEVLKSEILFSYFLSELLQKIKTPKDRIFIAKILSKLNPSSQMQKKYLDEVENQKNKAIDKIFFIEPTLNWEVLPHWAKLQLKEHIIDYNKNSIQETTFYWSHIKDLKAKNELLIEWINAIPSMDQNAIQYLTDFSTKNSFKNLENWQKMINTLNLNIHSKK